MLQVTFARTDKEKKEYLIHLTKQLLPVVLDVSALLIEADTESDVMEILCNVAIYFAYNYEPDMTDEESKQIIDAIISNSKILTKVLIGAREVEALKKE